MARSDARWVVIVVRHPIRRNPHARGAAYRVPAGGQSRCRRRECVAAKQSDLRLLVGRQPERGRIVGDRSGDQTAVVAPTEGDVRLDLIDLVELILDLSRLLESLVVINAEDSF